VRASGLRRRAGFVPEVEGGQCRETRFRSAASIASSRPFGLSRRSGVAIPALGEVDVVLAGRSRLLREAVQYVDCLAKPCNVQDPKLAATVNADFHHAWPDGLHRLPIQRSLAGLDHPQLKA